MTEASFTQAVESTHRLLLEAKKDREDLQVLLVAIRTAYSGRGAETLTLEEQTLLAVARKVEEQR